MKYLVSCLIYQSVTATLFLRDFEDPCVRLCEEFTADRRGAGYNLCDTENLSQCVRRPVGHTAGEIGEFCTDLYWSQTDDGLRGLLYDTTPLDEEPVTCLEASSTAGAFLNGNFHAGLEIFLNFEPVRERLGSNTTNEFLLALSEYTDSRSVTPQYSRLKQLQDLVNMDEVASIFFVVMAMSEAAHMTEVFFDTEFSAQTRCTDCGNLFVENESTDIIHLRAPEPRFGQQTSLLDLLNSEFRLPETGRFACPECRRNTDSICACRIQHLDQVLAIQIRSAVTDDAVVIPQEIDMAQYLMGTESPMLYQLVAASPTGTDAFVRREAGRWDYVSETQIVGVMIPESMMADPGSSNTFFYQRINSE